MWRDIVPPQLLNKGKRMKKFLVKINAYQYHSEFEVLTEDNVESIENSIVDKIGEKGVKWEYLGEMMDPKMNRITYEEVIDGQRPIQTKTVLGVEVAVGV